MTSYILDEMKAETFRVGRDYRIVDINNVESFFRVCSVVNSEGIIYIELKNIMNPEEPKVISSVIVEDGLLVSYPWGKKSESSPKITADDYLVF